MQVREIMTPNPVCCTPDSTLQTVAKMMEQNDCGCIPVVDSMTAMKPVGTITDRDITIRTVAAGHNPIDTKASEIMTSDVATVKPEMSVEECFDVMEDKEIRRVLVVDEQGKCCGIVAQADVVQSTASPLRTNKVIREISESAPSRSQNISMDARENRRDYQSYSDNRSASNSSMMLPLLIGLGSGAALTYMLGSRRNAARRDHYDNLNAYYYEHENRQDLTDRENFGRYVDAEEEIEKRQHDLENRVHTLRTESNSPLYDRPDSFNRDDEMFNNTGRDRNDRQK